MTPSTPSRLSTVHERPTGGSSASSPSTRPGIVNSSGSTPAPGSNRALKATKKKSLGRILSYLHQRINFSGHSDSDTITVLNRGYNDSRDKTCQDVEAKQSAPRWRQAQGTVVTQSGVTETTQLFASRGSSVAYPTPPRIPSPPLMPKQTLVSHLPPSSRPSSPSPTPAMVDPAPRGLGALPADVAALISTMRLEMAEEKHKRQKMEGDLRRHVEVMQQWGDELVLWSNGARQVLGNWAAEQASRPPTTEDEIRQHFQVMFDEAMERRTRELAVSRRESRSLIWHSIAFKLSEANNPRLGTNPNLSVTELEREISHLDRNRFRMSGGKSGDDEQV